MKTFTQLVCVLAFAGVASVAVANTAVNQTAVAPMKTTSVKHALG